MIEFSLLGTVAVGMPVRELGEQSIRGQKRNGGNVRPGLRRGQVFRVMVQETSQGFIVALAHEVGLPDGGVREWGIKGERRWSDQQGQ